MCVPQMLRYTYSAPAPEYWNKGGHGQFGGGTWRARGARAYIGDLRQSPQRGPGEEPLVRGSAPLKLKAF